MSSPLFGDAYRPAFVPGGYELIDRFVGAPAQGYASVDSSTGSLTWQGEEVCYLFRKGADKDSWTYPLTVHVGANPEWELTATENQVGEAVDLGLPGVSAAYHDGILMGSRKFSAGGGSPWVQNGVNSLTVRWAGGIWAARGAQQRGVSQADLVAMAKSVHFS